MLFSKRQNISFEKFSGFLLALAVSLTVYRNSFHIEDVHLPNTAEKPSLETSSAPFYGIKNS